MRAALLLAIFGTLALIVAWFLAKGYLRRTRNRRRIEELEAENERIDGLLERQRKQQSVFKKP
ncbi:MAG TPA: hypothetical protein VGM80_03200 [Gaiellaceae bacterium]